MTAPVASGWSDLPGGPCTHWRAPPSHGAHPERTCKPFWGRYARGSHGLEMTQSRHRCIAASYPSFDHLVGTGEQRGWDVEAKDLGGLEVYDKLELGRLLDRKIGGSLTSED